MKTTDSQRILALWWSFHRKGTAAFHDVAAPDRVERMRRYWDACERLRPAMVRLGIW